jgi:hypothetical protein
MTGDYRFLILNAEAGTFRELVLVCIGDSDALLLARGIGGGCDVEIWEDNRLVGVVRPQPPRQTEAAA